tara:strand:+ start:7097 stop:8017 length:921 start_codon:yes stop_codon:yes gene_type:complete
MSRIVPNLTLLHQFIATAEEGSISRAATQLGISQPALSKNIRKFEEIVGTDLFYRHTRGAELSEAGQAFLKHAELIALEYEHALQEVSNILENRKATIRIGAQGVWSSTYLPHAAKKFRKLFPKHQLSVSSGNTDELSKGLKIGKIDIFAGVLDNRILMPGFSSIKLGQARLVIMASENHPIFQLQKQKISRAIAKYPFVQNHYSKEVFEKLLSIMRLKNLSPPQVAIETSSMFASLELVRNDNYLIFDTSLLMDTPIGKGVTTVPFEPNEFLFDTGLAFRKGIEKISHYNKLIKIVTETLIKTKL